MGFFQKMGKMVADTAAAYREGRDGVQRTAQMVVKPWKVPPATRTYRLPADHEATVYTYNGAPLAGIPNGERFTIAAVPADVEMESAYTGMIASSVEWGNIAYEYNGQIFGMASSHAPAIKKLLEHGYRVEVEAYIKGYDRDAGYPKVCGLFGFVDDGVYFELGR